MADRPGSEVARENWNAYSRMRDYGHAKFVEEADKFNRYYLGDQWDPADLAKLGKRPALTINAVLSTVNAVIGEYVGQRGDVQFKPRQMDDHETAVALSQLMMAIQDGNDFESVEKSVFEDGIITDRGYFDVRMDFSENLMGEVKITSLDPLDVLLDPHAKEYDPDTWAEVATSRWMTILEVEDLYGKEKAEQLKYGIGNGGSFGIDSVELMQKEQSFGGDEAMGYNPDAEVDPTMIKRVRVIERQHRKRGKVKLFVDVETGDTKEVPEGWEDERVMAFAQQMGLEVLEQTRQRIRWTVSSCDVLLHDEWSPYRQFTVVPFFPYFRRGRPMGIVRNLISPQDQLNKVSSQELHVVNTSANSGYIIDEGALINMSHDELEQRGAETGLVLVKAQGKEIQKIQPNQIPSGLSNIANKSAESIRTISGVNTSVLGLDGAEVSGVAMNVKAARGVTQMQTVFDNLNRTRKIVARHVLNLVQAFYTEPRVYRVTSYKTPTPQDEQVAINQPTPEGDILNNVTLGKYDVVVNTVPARDTFLDSQFAQALEMRQAGVMVPDDVVVENSNLVRKNEIAEQIRQMTGRGELTPEQEQMLLQQQELEMRMAIAQLAEQESKAQKLMGEAQLAQARAQSEGVGHQVDMAKHQQQMQMEIAKLQADMQKTAANLQNKLELAELHSGNKSHLTAYNANMRRVADEAKQAHERAMKRADILKEMTLAGANQARAQPTTQEV